ncbi:hypothetical protein DESUT3_08790 [Desulfuromonas versatilis]|uniref:histidine kinase n=1 Tax=Desulfuromonas versatilis TaxID=2802975 RepID=A0ABM8HQ25_9BACT|nr:PAS domain-containing sensor histidine kinase [Desulfuromonas versatilis]BCR03810.1 hypothetical protein DESUT3_08790 [Desulfuromonas versatilis]
MKYQMPNDQYPLAELEQMLQASENRFCSIIDKSADAILIIDEQGLIRFANPACWTLFGRPPQELLGEAFGYPISGGEAIEIEVIGKNQPPGIVEMMVVETEWEGEKALLATLRDITRRKNLERELKEALEESEQARNRIDTILRSVAEGLIVTDDANRVLLMNQAAELMLGVACREVKNSPIEDLFQDQEVKIKFLVHLGKRPGRRFDFRLPGRDPKHPVYIQAKASPISDREGQKLGLITILQDVTQEREIEHMKSEFVSLAAHELGSPLTSIVGFSEVLLAKPDISPKEQRRYIEIIRDQGFAMGEIIGSFLDISRIEAGQPLPLSKGLYTPSDLMKKAEPFLRLHQGNYQFEVDLVASDTYLIVDRKRMRQVLVNLLSNAVKYSDPGTTIRIVGRPEGSGYRIEVRDQGIGMSEEQREKIFDKFYRADTSDTAVSGMGLGMSIVKYIVEAHGGSLGVESALGRGTTVWFAVPGAPR